MRSQVLLLIKLKISAQRSELCSDKAKNRKNAVLAQQKIGMYLKYMRILNYFLTPPEQA
jgi:hypothetical protein